MFIFFKKFRARKIRKLEAKISQLMIKASEAFTQGDKCKFQDVLENVLKLANREEKYFFRTIVKSHLMISQIKVNASLKNAYVQEARKILDKYNCLDDLDLIWQEIAKWEKNFK